MRHTPVLFLTLLLVPTSLYATPIESKEDDPRFQIAENLQKSGDYSAALAELDRIDATSPNDAEVFFERGYIYLFNLKDYDKAAAAFSKSIELDDTFVNRLYRGEAYHKNGLLDKAIADFTKGLNLKSELRKQYSERNDIATKFIDLVKVDDAEIKAYYHLGRAYEDKGSYSKAISVYTEGINLNYPDSQLCLHVARAVVYVELKQYSKALPDLDKSLEEGAKHPKLVYDLKADIYRRLGEYGKSKEWAQKAKMLREE